MSQARSAPLSPETQELLQVMAYLHLQNGKARDALALLEACDRAGGCQGRGLVLLALTQLRAGAAETALHTLDRADPAARAHGSYRVVRAQILVALGRHAEARQLIKAYAAQRPGVSS